jgi:Na+/H+-dicarboxylate symporter
MPLHSKILLGLALGAVAGVLANLALGPQHWFVAGLDYYVAGPLGQVFLRMLSMVVMPLVFASITLGVAGVGDVRRLGRMGARTLGFFLVTTALATGLGLALVQWVQPGTRISVAIREQLLTDYAGGAAAKIDAASTAQFGIDTLVGIVTRNPIKSAVEGDMLGIIFFGLVFGAALTMIRDDRRQAMITWLEALADVVTTIIDFAMRIAPYGVAGLIFGVTSRFGFALLAPLGVYVALVLCALLVHAAVTMSVLIRVLVGLPPLVFFRRIRASPGHRLQHLLEQRHPAHQHPRRPAEPRPARQRVRLRVPTRRDHVHERHRPVRGHHSDLPVPGVRRHTRRRPDGGRHGHGRHDLDRRRSRARRLDPPDGRHARDVRRPPEGIAVILGVDRILDMARTAVNVLGDHTAAAYIARSEGSGSRTCCPPSQAPTPPPRERCSHKLRLRRQRTALHTPRAHDRFGSRTGHHRAVAVIGQKRYG